MLFSLYRALEIDKLINFEFISNFVHIFTLNYYLK